MRDNSRLFLTSFYTIEIRSAEPARLDKFETAASGAAQIILKRFVRDDDLERLLPTFRHKITHECTNKRSRVKTNTLSRNSKR